MSLLFGTAGVPHGSRKRSTLSGIKRIKEIGLGAMEVEWVRGVRMGEELASKVNDLSNDLGIKLTGHGPFWINLNSEEDKKLEQSKGRVLRTIRRGYQCGCESVTFHPAYYLNQRPEEVYNHLKGVLQGIISEVNIGSLKVSLETTGKRSQFGTVDEILGLAQEIDNVSICLDFAHIFARSQGKVNSYEQFRGILEKVENKLGSDALKNIHVHLAGIAYGKGGEKRHLFLKDSEFRYKEVLEALKDLEVEGILICESPIPERDILLVKETYNSL